MPCSETPANGTIPTLGYIVLMVMPEMGEGKSNCESLFQTPTHIKCIDLYRGRNLWFHFCIQDLGERIPLKD